jgi:hypothetical protein
MLDTAREAGIIKGVGEWLERAKGSAAVDQATRPYLFYSAKLGLFSVPAPPFHASGRRGFFFGDEELRVLLV